MNRSTNGIAMALFLVGLFALSGCVPPVVAAAETTFPVRGRVVLPPQLGRPEPMKVVPKPMKVVPMAMKVVPEPMKVAPKPMKVFPEPMKVVPKPMRWSQEQ